MKTQLKTTLLVLLTFTLINCTKNDDPQDQLPPITQTGANTFGLIYDGIIFTPKRYNGSTTITENQIPITIVEYYTNKSDASYKLLADRGENVKNLSYIYIYQLHLKGKGDYLLNNAPYESNPYPGPLNNYIFCYAQSSLTGEWKHYGSFSNSGKITITRKDSDNNIFSGTFSGKLKEENGSEIIEITDGRFDININTLN